MSLSDIVDISITADSVTLSRAGFGTPVILTYHTRFADSFRVYSAPSEMIADGFKTYDDAYRIAAAIFDQDPSPQQVIVGRLTAAPSFVTKLHVETATEGRTLKATYLEPQSGTAVDISRTVPAASTAGAEATALAALINAVDVDAIKTNLASATGIQSLTSADFNGVTAGVLSPPRRVTFTFSSHADWDATNITLTGLDASGASVSETIAIPNGGNATVVSTNLYSLVTGVTVPAQSGAGGTGTIGVRAGVSASVSNTTYVDVTPYTAGRKVHVYGLTYLTQEETTADANYDDELTNLQLENDSWYFILIDTESKANVDKVAAFALTAKKLFFFASASDAELTSAGTLFNGLYGTANDRVAGLWAPNSHEFGGARWVGYGAARDPGKVNWGHRQLKGLTGKTLNSTQKNYLEGDKGNHFQVRNSVSATLPGNVSSGEWIDVRHGLDALMADIQETVYLLFVASDGVPYTPKGLDMVASAILAAMKRFEAAGGQKGLIAEGTSKVILPEFSTISPSDKAARRLRGIRISGTLEGAINYVTATGTLST